MNTATMLRRAGLAGTPVAILIVCGIAAHVSPVFKQHATTAGIVFLALVALSGLLGGFILRRLETATVTTSSERPPDALTTTASTAHTGGHQ